MLETKREFNIFNEDVESFELEEAYLLLIAIEDSVNGLLNLNCDPVHVITGVYNGSYAYQSFKKARYWFDKTGINCDSWFRKHGAEKVASFQVDRGSFFLGRLDFIINNLKDKVIYVLNKNITPENNDYISKCIEHLNYVIYFLELERDSIKAGFRHLNEDRFNELIKDTDNCNCSNKFIIERREYLKKNKL